MRPPALLGPCVISLVVIGAPALAQAPSPTPPPAQPPRGAPTPARDNQSQEKTGTARLSGRVTAGDTGKPVRRALVQLTSPDNPQGRSISTDPDGRWELKTLPAGSYRIRVQKGGYVALFYGQQRPFAQGKVVDVSDGQVVDKLDVSLPRAGVISGVVLDEFGEPVTAARVTAMRYGYANGQRRLVGTGSSDSTDDIGQYRLYGLTPGEYVISATMGPMIILNASEDRMGYATTYYPGTPTAAEAQRVRVAEGQEIQQITFNMATSRVAVISGTASNAAGRPINRGYITLVSFNESGAQMGLGSQLKPDGSFSFSSVSPGEYRVSVQYTPDSDGNGSPIGPVGLSTEYASVPITVNGRDVTGLSLVTTTGGSARGKLTFEGGLPASISPASIMVGATPMSMALSTMMGGGSARVRDDWTFEVLGLFDRRRFRINTPPPGWYLKSVTQDGNDVTDTGIDFAQGQKVSNVEIVLTQRAAGFAGMVQDARDKPVNEYVVVAFSSDSSRWGYMTRYVRSARPNQEGRFSITGLPADEYFIVALDYVESGEETDPEQLEKWKSLATRVTLSDGESKSMTLKLVTQGL
jgi:protocatechuate 3,4-dioxygenase beta subunit